MLWEIRRFAEIGSTNTWLLEQAASGAPEGTVVVADHQTAGRGRLDRNWESPPAGVNLLCSVLLRPRGHAELAPVRVGLAARDACETVTGGAARPAMKWPNDLLLHERKIAGVLAEVDPKTKGIVVGLGLNIGWAPEDAGRLDDEAPFITRDAVLEAFLVSLERWLDAPDHQVHAAHRAACDTIGRMVMVQLVDGTSFEAEALDLDDHGRLIVRRDGKKRTVEAGDVVHLR